MSAVKVCFEGNLTSDPEIRTTQSGKQFMTLSFACNERKFNKQTQTWEDGETLYLTATEWDERQQVAYTKVLHKGVTCKVEGNLRPTASTDRNGQPKAYLNVDHATVTLVIKKAKAEEKPSGFIGNRVTVEPAPAADPWAGYGEPEF